MDCKKTKLSNGLEVLLVPSRSSPVVALQGWVRYGAADEARDAAGVAHLFEHLLFKGTKKRAVGQIAREIEGLGGDLNAYTSYDQTVMHMTLPSKNLDQGIDILADSLIDSVVDEDELVREKEVILEEIRRRNDMPASIAGDLLREELYGTHPYARPVIGYTDVVHAMPRERILSEYKKHYTAKKLFLVIAGDFDETRTLEACAAAFRDLPQGTPLDRKPAGAAIPARAGGPRSSFRHNPSPDAIIHMGWLGVDGTHPDNAALDALALIVGQGHSSRLIRKLVHERRLVRDIGCGSWSPRERGYFGISMKGPAGTGNRLAEITQAVHECISAPITEAELEKAKKNLLSSAVYSKETVDGLAQRFGYCEAIAGRWELDSEYLAAVSALRTSDLENARAKYLDWQQVACCGIVPEGDKLPIFAPPSDKPKPAPKTSAAGSAKKESGVETFRFRGMTVLLRRLPQLPIFSARWVGLGGIRVEPGAKSGLGTLWARAVAEGGRSADGKVWTRDELNDLVDRSSASLSAFHGRNSWGFQSDGLSEDFEKMFMLMAAVREEPLFDPIVVADEKRHQTLDIRSSKDSPGSVVGNLFLENLFGKHPYGRPTLGEAKSLAKLARKDLLAYHAQLMKQPQVLAVVGDVDRARLEAALERFVREKSFPRNATLLKARPPKFSPKHVSARKKLKKEQTHILTGFPSCTIGHQDRWALTGLAAVLAGQGGRLFLELRDKMSLCYSVYPSRMEAIDGGYFGFSIATSPDKEKIALDALDREIHRVREDGVPEEEWARAKQFLRGSHEIESQHYAGQASEMAMNELYGLGFEETFRFAAHLDTVKAVDLGRVARKYFGAGAKSPRVTAIVGPK